MQPAIAYTFFFFITIALAMRSFIFDWSAGVSAELFDILGIAFSLPLPKWLIGNESHLLWWVRKILLVTMGIIFTVSGAVGLGLLHVRLKGHLLVIARISKASGPAHPVST